MANDTLPVVADAANYSVLAQFENKIVVGRIPHLTEVFPDYYHPGDYVLMLIKGGTMAGTVNLRPFEINAPAAMFVSVEHILHLSETCGDVQVETLAFKHSVAEELKTNMPLTLLQQLMVRPLVSLTDEEMSIAQDFFKMAASVIRCDTVANKYAALLPLVRSLSTLLCGIYQAGPGREPLSRAEEIAGRFMMLAESSCHEHHDIGWYASELCLSPKYLANVVKTVTGMTAGQCISENLASQAKSLLLTTTLTIQQISDRLGFQNQSHFGTFFRRHTGLNPKAFRQSL